MAHEVTIEPTRASVAGEGQALVLEMESLKDIRFLNKQLVEFGIRNLKRVNQYLERLDQVMAGTDDERIIVAGTSVAVNALKAVVAALKQESLNVQNNTQINIHGARPLSELSDDELRAIRKLARDGQAQTSQGDPSGPQGRDDGHACEDQ